MPLSPTRLDRVLADRFQAAHQILQLLDPNQVYARTGLAGVPGKYGPIIHAAICRHKMLGLGDSSCAKAVGILPTTLARWKEAYPQLATDMEQAAQLVNSEVIKLLLNLMHDQGPVALSAVKYFLSRRAHEFKDKAQVEITSADPAAVDEAISHIFGIGSHVDVTAQDDAADLDAPPPPAAAPLVAQSDLPDDL